jgi:hypothetical protein
MVLRLSKKPKNSDALESALSRLLKGTPADVEPFLRNIEKRMALDGTRILVHCHIFQLDGNKSPRSRDFADWLSQLVIEYAITPDEIKKAYAKDKAQNTTTNVSSLQNKARRLFSTLKNSGEGGELLLYALLDRYLRIPQILCKMGLKTNRIMHVHGIDGIHAQVTSQGLALYWGESKLHKSLSKGLNEALVTVKPYLLRQGLFGEGADRDIQLVRDNLGKVASPELQQRLLRLLDPTDPAFNKVEFRGACLVGFDSAIYKKTSVDDLANTAKAQLARWVVTLKDALKRTGDLDDVEIDVLFLPFPGVDKFRQFFFQALGIIQ